MSNFVVSSLKYRPKDFESVVGQNHVTNTLKNSITENKVPSAILFSCFPSPNNDPAATTAAATAAAAAAATS